MGNSEVEQLLNEMYTLLQEARSVPLSQEKCIIERERALDLMEEIMSKWPTEVRDAQAIIASRTDLIAQARREGEGIIRNAKDQAEKLVTQEAIYAQAKQKCEEMVMQTKGEMDRIQAAAFAFMADSLQETERTVAASMATISSTREKFQALTSEAKKNIEA